MNMVSMWEDDIPEPSQKRKAELAALAKRPDSEIDYTDLPPLDDRAFENAIPWKDVPHSALYKPRKIIATVRIDADVMAWLKQQGRGYQTRLNAILRDAMLQSHPPVR